MNDNQTFFAKTDFRYEFLNDPNLRDRLVKIKKELHRTKYKLKKKKKDNIVISGSMLATAILITSLIINQEVILNYVAIASAVFYLCISWLLIKKIIYPLNLDMKYLNKKAKFLTSKKLETKVKLKSFSNSKKKSASIFSPDIHTHLEKSDLSN